MARVPLAVMGVPLMEKMEGTLAATEVTVPTVGVAQVGAKVVPALVKTCPEVPFARRVPVPEAPPYTKSPPVVRGDKASKAAAFVVAPVPP